ncbi:uncharacterized protein LOC114356077 [Ostrinia furnacalis]|uniref:uncharacterized protein LOC114356077 n=1 Tax=Ostrinia furnacalis TaxID=93504 RepID=UPI00103C42AC|nr:uncharacterized protein LOC114356077 [Ostrinia furnacalis]
MAKIESYVFFDIETTGLPYQEKNQTKITELSFVVASQKDIIATPHGTLPPVSKLTLVFNPERPIHVEAVKLNGLSNDLLQHAPVFKQKTGTIVTFLKQLTKPVCLVAHNGNRFDFKILLTEFCDANMFLPDDLLCVDSLTGFRKILAMEKVTKALVPKPPPIELGLDLLTDDEDEWPQLNVSTEEWKDIDEICDSLSDISCEDITEVKKKTQYGVKKPNRSKVIDKVFSKTNNGKTYNYSLSSLYQRLLNKEQHSHHRAEGDCCMLLECVIACKDAFIPWADDSCRKLSEIEPLIRKY